MDLFNTDVRRVLDDIETLQDIIGNRGENTGFINIQDAMIIEEIRAMIDQATPENGYGWIQKIKGMMKIRYSTICDIAEAREDVKNG